MANATKVRVIVSTADRARRAEVTMPSTTTVDEMLAACRRNWNLPAGEDFAMRDTRQNLQLRGKETLAQSGVIDGTELQLFPLLEAGA